MTIVRISRLNLVAFVTAALAEVLGPAMLAQTAPAEPDRDATCGIIYGSKPGSEHAFSLCAPKGWQLDNSVLSEEGIFAVFYPQGSSWDEARNAGSAMYVNTIAKGKPPLSITGAMKNDAEDTRKQAPNAAIREGDSLQLKNPKDRARVQIIEHGPSIDSRQWLMLTRRR